MSKVVLIAIVGLGVPIGAHGQDVAERNPDRIEHSIFTTSEHPVLFKDLKLRSTDLLEASLSVEDKGAKVVYAPFIYGLANYRPFMSETRLQLSQKDNLTTLGIGALYNPTSPRSHRGATLWSETADNRADAPAILLLRDRLSAAIDEINTILDRIQNSTAGADDQSRLAVLNSQVQAINRDLGELERAEDARIKARILRYDEALAFTGIPVIGVNYNNTLFQILGGSRRDADNDQLRDTAHRVKKHALSVSADIRPSARVMLSLLGTHEWDRPSQEEGVNMDSFVGYGFTVGGIVGILNSQYRETEEYRNSLFIPSVVAGLAMEGRHCREATTDDCPDRKTREMAFTPFIDIKVTKTAQFRVGFPIKRTTKPDDTTSELGTVTAFSLQLGQPR